MKLPKKLNILGLDIKVQEGSLKGFLGIYNYPDKEITIDVDNCNKYNENITQVLIHEMVHAVIHRSGIGQTLNNLAIEEVLCDSIANIMVDNFDIKAKGLPKKPKGN